MAGPFAGMHGCLYDEDEDGDEYVTIGFNLPEGVYAEIEDGTYGTLQGFRIYLRTVEAEPDQCPVCGNDLVQSDDAGIIYCGEGGTDHFWRNLPEQVSG